VNELHEKPQISIPYFSSVVINFSNFSSVRGRQIVSDDHFVGNLRAEQEIGAAATSNDESTWSTYSSAFLP